MQSTSKRSSIEVTREISAIRASQALPRLVQLGTHILSATTTSCVEVASRFSTFVSSFPSSVFIQRGLARYIVPGKDGRLRFVSVFNFPQYSALRNPRYHRNAVGCSCIPKQSSVVRSDPDIDICLRRSKLTITALSIFLKFWYRDITQYSVTLFLYFRCSFERPSVQWRYPWPLTR
jgi:hypothetical protein